MGQPEIPIHRLSIGWICLSIACILSIYCMIRFWLDMQKTVKSTQTSAPHSKVSVASNTPKPDDQSIDLPSTPTSPNTETSQPSPNDASVNKAYNTSNVEISSRLKSLIWCTLICYFIFNAYVLLSRFYVFVIEQDRVNISCFIWVFPQITSFMSGRMFLYLLWCDRFYSAFKDSMFEKSKIFTYIMSIGIIISMLFAMAFYLIIYVLYAGDHCQLSGDKGHLLIAALPFTVFDLIWSIIVLYLFNGHLSKLLYVSIEINKSTQHHRILQIIKKLNILVNISILSTWLILVSIYSYAPLSASAIDGIINTICILLSLNRYHIIYNKTCFVCINHYESCFMRFCCCCCKWCHKGNNQEKVNDIDMLAIEVNN